MKNKKIILGLGTITALGAMSMGFVACKKAETKKEESKDDKGGVVYFNELTIKQQTEIFNEWVKNIITEAKKDDGTDAKNTDLTSTEDSGKFAKEGATVNDLIKKIKEKITKFDDKFEFVLAENEGTEKLDGKTSYGLTIKKKGVDVTKKPHLKTDKKIDFKFTLKS